MADFLLEIGLEEVPARMIDGAREELARRIGALLTRERLVPAGGPQLMAFSTPRRLAALARGLVISQPDMTEEVSGPAVKVAFKDGAPTPAAEAFAKKVGVAVSKLTRVDTAKGEYLAARVTRKGRAAAEVLAESLPKEIAGLYWAKSMYWRGKSSERFVRPVRWLVAMLDGDVVPLEFAGIHAGNQSRGHRVLGMQHLKIRTAAGYESTLEKANVIADPRKREQKIRAGLDQLARPSGKWRQDDVLLNTVVNLTESPSVISGGFDGSYLSLPAEILVTVMRDHQKYFAVEDAAGKLAPNFLAVLNTDSDPEGLIRHGNERVLRARFNDAQFFWAADQKIPLSERIEMLKSVTFQKDLGSYHDKAQRMSYLVNVGGADFDRPGRKINRNALHQAAWLAKTDLTTELVKEFTELQGIVGGLYARAQKVDAAVADAIYDHYKPASMEDAVPHTLEGAILAIADKSDSIAGMFALGLQPTGSKDPFALRRQANGILRIVAEHKLPIDLKMLFLISLDAYKGSEAAKRFIPQERSTAAIAAFFRERLEFYLREVMGFAYDVVNAVLAVGSTHVLDAIERARAVAAVRTSEDFESISLLLKRIKNILRQAAEAGHSAAGEPDSSLLHEPAESALAAQAQQAAAKVALLRGNKDYSGALGEIAKVRPALDTFFEKVMVMADDPKLRANRLALLQRLLTDFSTIADFSEIVTEKK